ncbi:MAG: urease accessory protein UreF [Alphaproteobacteria bacterium]|nr:urease accessory protein UreF [Alphaproteobacteria bacterium]
MTTATETPVCSGLYRLLTWLSPAFPTGAFSYSHGLEAAVAYDAVRDRATLHRWIAAIVVQGSGRTDTDILRDAYRAQVAGDAPGVAAANRRGLAYRPTAELALESNQQGEAFRATWRAAWHEAAPDAMPLPLPDGEAVCLPAMLGMATAEAGITLDEVLLAYLQALAGNLVSAGLRLGVIGQTDGQRIMAALEPLVCAAAAAVLDRDPADFGGATFALDVASMAHETQYSRLFRS